MAITVDMSITIARIDSNLITLFKVYNDTDCSGALFTLDTTWQRFTSLNTSQVASLSVLSSPNNTGLPCVANWTSGAASSTFQCYDTVGYAGTNYSGAQASGYSVPGCDSVLGNIQPVYKYLAGGSDSSTVDSSACQPGTVRCLNCSKTALAVGMRVQCTVPSPSNSETAASQSSLSTLLVALLVSLTASVLGSL